MSTVMRFGLIGTGFWAPYQLAGWRELDGVECVAAADADLGKAQAFAREHGVPAAYGSAEDLMDREQPDFVDIVASPEAHGPLVKLAAARRIPVICQKPLANSLEEARGMAAACEASGTPLLVHENWRWQTPIRAFREELATGALGRIARGRIDYAHSFPVFENQPFLKTLDRFILMDMGTHLLDVARFIWGEAEDLFCQTRRMRDDIRGEDVATVLMRMQDDVPVTCSMSYASVWQFDRFPQTVLFAEGSEAGLTLDLEGTVTLFRRGAEPVRKETSVPHFGWADPDYAVIHSSIVACCRDLLGGLRGAKPAETTARDNLKTLELVFGAYESAESGRPLRLGKSSAFS